MLPEPTLRLATIASCLIAIFLYTPINRLLKSGHEVKIPLDDLVPFWPWTVYPYMFLYVAWMGALYGSFLWMPLAFVEQAAYTTLLAVAIGYTCFLVWPTYVVTPYPKGKNLAIRLLQWLHDFDKQFNACPSMHVYMTTVFALLSWQVLPTFWWLWLGIAIVISITTNLTKRHYLADIAGGVVVGVISYYAILAWMV